MRLTVVGWGLRPGLPMWLLLLLLDASARPQLSAGYLGSFFTQPGGFAGLEESVARGRVASFSLGGRTGVYHHPRHHTGIALIGEARGSLTASFGLFAEGVVGLGVHHRLLAGPVYVERDGELVRRLDGGRPTLLVPLGFGAGWVVARSGPRPVRVFGRLETWLRAPVNHHVRTNLVFSTGVGVPLGSSP